MFVLGLVLMSLSCASPQPDVVEARFPTDTPDEGGPYQVSVHTWGPVDSVQLLVDGASWSEDTASVLAMTSTKPDHWAGLIPGAKQGEVVTLRLRINGPGGTLLFPRSRPHTFRILELESGCSPECEANETCVDGRCRAREICLNDGQCLAGQRCERGQCIPDQNECDDNTQCPGALRCENGLCQPECSDSDECDSNQTCIDGLCQTPPPDCSTNEECNTGQICTDGRCEDDDGLCPGGCPESQFCAQTLGRCVECVSDEDCGSGSVCRLRENRCTEPCGRDANEPNDSIEDATDIRAETLLSARSCLADTDFFRATDGVDSLKIVGIEAQQTGVFLVFYEGSVAIEEIYVESEDTLPLLSPVFSVTAADIEVEYDVFTFRDDEPIQCEEDVFEPNDARNLATLIGSQGALVSANLCPDNIDWFGVRRRRRDGPGELVIKTIGPSLDIELQNSEGEPLEDIRLTGFPNPVRLEDNGPWTVLNYGDPRETVFLNVDCRLCGNVGTPYWIASRAEPQDGNCPEDIFEPNQGPNNAALIARTGDATELPDMTVCDHDEDWYLIDKVNDSSLRFTIEFVRQRGDIDLFLYSDSLELIDYDIDGSGEHQVFIDAALPEGTYFVRVALFGGGRHTYTGRIQP